MSIVFGYLATPITAQAEEPHSSCGLRMFGRPVSSPGVLPCAGGTEQGLNKELNKLFNLLIFKGYVSIFKNANKYFLP